MYQYDYRTLTMETENFISPNFQATEEVKTEPSQEPDFGFKIDAVFSLAAANEESDDTSREQTPDNDKSSEEGVMLNDIIEEANQELVNQKSEEVPQMPDFQKGEKYVNNECFEMRTAASSNSEKERSDTLDKTEKVQQTNNTTAEGGTDLRKPVTFHPCFVLVDDVIEHHVMKAELARLRTKEENLKKKQERQKELEEIKANRQKALRGYNSRVFAPFIEDPEEIIKKKIDISKQIHLAEEKSSTKKKKCSENDNETPTAIRRSLRRRKSSSDTDLIHTNYHDNNPIGDECKADMEKQINNENADSNASQHSSVSDCRPSRKRKVSKLLSGNSFIVDVREMKTVWQENIEMEKILQAEEEKRQNKINGSVYRLYYGRQQTAKTKTKLKLKRREDMPFLSIKLNKTQVAGICEGQYNTELQSNLSSTDLNTLPLYLRTDLKMEETSRGTYKFWRLHRPKTKEKSKVKNKRRTIQDKSQRKFIEEDVAQQKTLKRKQTCSSINSERNTPKEESKTVDENNLNERVPCSLVGRCRKPYSRYSSEYVTNFKRNWKHDLKMATTIKTENNADDSSSEMTDSASETQEIESRNVSPCKDLKAEILTSPEIQNRKHIIHPPVRTASDRKATTSTTNSNGVSMAPNVTTGVNASGEPLKSYPHGFMNTVAHLAKQQNTKKFFQISIGDKIVLIPTDGCNIIPKAFVMDSMNPVASCISQVGQTIQGHGNPNPTLFVSNQGVPPQHPSARLNNPIVTAATSPKIPPVVSSYQNTPVMKETIVRFPTPPRLPTPLYTSVAQLPSLIPKPLSDHQGPSSQVLMPASSILSSLSTAVMSKTTTTKDNVPFKNILSKPTDNYAEVYQPKLDILIQQPFGSRVNQTSQSTIACTPSPAQHTSKSESEENGLFEISEKIKIENEMNIISANTPHSFKTEKPFVNTSQNAFNGKGNKDSSEIKYEESSRDLKTDEMNKIGVVDQLYLASPGKQGHITEVVRNSTDNQSFDSIVNAKAEIGVTKKTEEIKRICSTETDGNCRVNAERNCGEESTLPLISDPVPFSKFLGDVIVSEINRYEENNSSGSEAISTSLIKTDKCADNENACKVTEHTDLDTNQGKDKGDEYEGHQNSPGNSHVADRNVDSHTIDHGFTGGRDLIVRNVSDSSVIEHGDEDSYMAEQDTVDSHTVEQEIVDSHMAAEQEIVDSRIVEQNIVDNFIAEQEIVDNRMAEQDIVDNRMVEQEIVDNRMVGQDIVDNRMAEQDVDNRMPEQGIANNRMAGQDVDNRMAGQAVDNGMGGQDVNNRMPEQDTVDNRKAEQDVDNRMAGQDVDNRMTGQDVDNLMAGQDVDNRMPEQCIVDNRMGAQDVDNHMPEQGIVDNRMPEQGFVDNRMPEQGIVDNRLAEQDIVDNRLAEQDIVDNRMAEQEIGDTHMAKQSDGDSRLTEKGEGSLSLEDRFSDKSFIKKEVPDMEYVTHVPVNESVAEERIRKLREKLRAKQAELESFRKIIHLRSDTEQEAS